MAGAQAIRRAGALATISALVVLSCGSETIDLLQDRSGGGAAMSGAGPISAGQSGAGSASQAGTATNGGGGSAAAGGSGGCAGASCGGSGGFGVGGFFNGCPYGIGCQQCDADNECSDREFCSNKFRVCVECDELDGCRQGFRCNLSTGRCAVSCEHSGDCDNGKVCDQVLGGCVQCSSDEQCENDQIMSTRRCALGQCVECTQASDCDDEQRPHCAPNQLRCVECLFDEQCPFDERCELGRCE